MDFEIYKDPLDDKLYNVRKNGSFGFRQATDVEVALWLTLTSQQERIKEMGELMRLAWIELEMVSPNAEITDKLFEALKE